MTFPATRCLGPMLMLMLMLMSLLQPLGAEDWPQWRGHDGQGHAVTQGLPLTWSEAENVAWKTDLPGLGWSSPVMLGEQIWLTTAETIAAPEQERAARQETVTNSQPVEIVKQVNMFAVCADKQTGAVQHHVLLMTDDDPDPIHVDNSYATPTPLYADGRIYFSDKAGRTTIVAASPEFKILARKQLDGVIMVSPAAVDGALFLRTDKALYRIQQAP